MASKRTNNRAASISPLERYGRIILAAAIGLLFLVITASMIAGHFLTPFIIASVVIGLVGAIMLKLGQ